jgi:hypothetical protein
VDQETLIQSGGYALARVEISQIMQIYATKMAGVFMISTSTFSLQIRIIPRWMAFLGYAPGALALAECRSHLMDAAGLPPVGARGQFIHPD